jgi:hypothetical protein
MDERGPMEVHTQGALSGQLRLPIPKEQALKKALTADAFIDASNDITTLTPIYSAWVDSPSFTTIIFFSDYSRTYQTIPRLCTFQRL